MDQTGLAQDKWAQTGWRIEQKYGSKVLIGNWAEERLQFTREPEAANSINRADYQPHWDFKPDVAARGSALLRAEGLLSKQLFAHYGSKPSHYLVTQYEESHGCKHTNALPSLRPWHPNSLTWQPERADWPIPAPPTNFGPPRSARRRLEKQRSHLPSLAVNRSAFQRRPLGALCQGRFARASHILSSHLHAANHDNKDLDLRCRSLLQVPDHCFGLPSPS